MALLRRTWLLAVALVGALSTTAVAQDVPLQTEQVGYPEAFYTQRSSISFAVIDCTGDQQLWQASREAAKAWNRVAPVRVDVALSDACTVDETLANRNTIRWGESTTESTSPLGLYRAEVCSDGFCGERIVVEPVATALKARQLGTDWYTQTYNTVLKHLGHALGLGDAAEPQGPGGCGWSVMVAPCYGREVEPMAADRRALDRLYGDADRSSPSVADFDTDDSGFIEKAELMAAAERWTQGEINKTTLIRVAESWQEDTPVQAAQHATTSSVAAIRVFDLQGRLVYEQPCAVGAPTRAMQRLEAGNFAKGAYLMALRNCESGRQQRKIVIIR